MALKEFIIASVASVSPVTVTTVEELDALPVGSVVVDRYGVVRTKRGGNTHMSRGWTAFGNHPIHTLMLADGQPMAVVWRPVTDRGEQ